VGGNKNVFLSNLLARMEWLVRLLLGGVQC
jgi:hypothetical protein